jgi:hypothetical protein
MYHYIKHGTAYPGSGIQVKLSRMRPLSSDDFIVAAQFQQRMGWRRMMETVMVFLGYVEFFYKPICSLFLFLVAVEYKWSFNH